jgi:hypothetical protein
VNGLTTASIVFSVAAVLVVVLAGIMMHDTAEDLRAQQHDVDVWSESLERRETDLRRRVTALRFAEQAQQALPRPRGADPYARAADPYAWAARGAR